MTIWCFNPCCYYIQFEIPSLMTTVRSIQKSANIEGLYISWQQHITNKELYGDASEVSDKVSAWRLKLADQCLRHPELPASSSVLWEPIYGRKSQWWPAKTMVDTPKEDTCMANTGELRTLMQDRDKWRVRCRIRRKSKEWSGVSEWIWHKFLWLPTEQRIIKTNTHLLYGLPPPPTYPIYYWTNVRIFPTTIPVLQFLHIRQLLPAKPFY